MRVRHTLWALASLGLAAAASAQTLEQAVESVPALTEAARTVGEPKVRHELKYRRVPGQLFVKGPEDKTAVSPADVTQGEIGDCYFLSSLAAVANVEPSFIHRMIRDNKDHTYTVTFYRHAQGETGGFEPVEVRVDDRFPERSTRPIFARVGDKVEERRELWVMVAEKAYAQFKGGSYHKIDGGLPHHALETILGKPSEAHRTSAVTFDQLARWRDKGFPLVAATKDRSSDSLYNRHILVTDHAYWIERVDERSRTVTLANPWGFKEHHITLSEEQFATVLDSVYLTPQR